MRQSVNAPEVFMEVGKLGLIMVVVRDMERSVAFYRDVL